MTLRPEAPVKRRIAFSRSFLSFFLCAFPSRLFDYVATGASPVRGLAALYPNVATRGAGSRGNLHARHRAHVGNHLATLLPHARIVLGPRRAAGSFRDDVSLASPAGCGRVAEVLYQSSCSNGTWGTIHGWRDESSCRSMRHNAARVPRLVSPCEAGNVWIPRREGYVQ